VGIFVNFTDNIHKIAELLADYNPVVVWGDIKKEKRQILFDRFQAPNLDYRVIIGNLKICSTGIDLDDKDGRFPRYAYACPNYTILDLHQLTRRFVRLDTKSDASFRFFYGKIAKKETSILSALLRKTAVLKDTLETQVGEGVKFPGDYEEEVEAGGVEVSAKEEAEFRAVEKKFSSFVIDDDYYDNDDDDEEDEDE
jgi:hypothetical protein